MSRKSEQPLVFSFRRIHPFAVFVWFRRWFMLKLSRAVSPTFIRAFTRPIPVQFQRSFRYFPSSRSSDPMSDSPAPVHVVEGQTPVVASADVVVPLG